MKLLIIEGSSSHLNNILKDKLNNDIEVSLFRLNDSANDLINLQLSMSVVLPDEVLITISPLDYKNPIDVLNSILLICNCCRLYGVKRIIYVSSVKVKNLLSSLSDESNLTEIDSILGLTAEMLIKYCSHLYNLDYLIIVLPNNYSSNDIENISLKILNT
jgi:hypothetical protein